RADLRGHGRAGRRAFLGEAGPAGEGARKDEPARPAMGIRGPRTVLLRRGATRRARAARATRRAATPRQARQRRRVAVLGRGTLARDRTHRIHAGSMLVYGLADAPALDAQKQLPHADHELTPHGG